MAFSFCDMKWISQLFQRSKSTDMLEKSPHLEILKHGLVF